MFINNLGLEQIKNFLLANHKKGEEIANNEDMLRAWAQDAEFQLGEGNSATIEIKAKDSVYSWAQEFTVSAEGIG